MGRVRSSTGCSVSSLMQGRHGTLSSFKLKLAIQFPNALGHVSIWACTNLPPEQVYRATSHWGNGRRTALDSPNSLLYAIAREMSLNVRMV